MVADATRQPCSTADRPSEKVSTMQKVTKEVAAPMIVAAWNATKGLPVAPEALVRGAVFYHMGNPAPPATPADHMDGHAGSISAAFNAIVLHCKGYRVPVALVKAVLSSATFYTAKGPKAGQYNPNHTSDLARLKADRGHFTICSTEGWVACNPEWYAARTGSMVAVPEPTIEQAPGLESAAKATAKKAATRKAVEATATPADLAAGKAATKGRSSKGK